MISSISLGKLIARSYTSASATEASTMSDESGTDAERSSRFLTERQFARRLLILSAFMLVGIILWLTVDLLLLVFASVIVAVLLHAIADPVARHTPVPEHFALAAAGIGLLVIFGLVGWFFGSEIQSQVSSLGDRIPEAWRSFQDRLRGTELGRQFLNWLETNILGGTSTASGAGRMLMSLGSAVVGFLVVIVGGIYLAWQPKLYRKGVIKLFTKQARPVAEATLYSSGRALKLWLLGQLVAMLIVGVLTGLGAWLIGLPSSIALGLVAGLLEFIPFAGPMLAAIPALLIALTMDTKTVIMTLALYTIIQQVEGNLITPIVQRQAVSLPPALTLFALIAMGLVFGPLGILFAAPLTVVTYVAVKQLYIRRVLGDDTSIPGERQGQEEIS